MSPPRALGVAFVLSLVIQAPASADTRPPAEALQDAPPAKSPLKVMIDLAKVDLGGHSLEVKLSRTTDKVTLKVFGESGATLAEVEKPLGAAAGTVFVMTWSPSSEEPVAKIDVLGQDSDGGYYKATITPWSFNVPHEEVNFETDSDVIRASEVSKLDASLPGIKDAVTKHSDLGRITLFVVGHTDTVGTVDHNIALSRKRARAIASWFKGRGLGIPIAYEGVGESGLLVKTADQVDEPRNRRAEYILGLAPPRAGADVAWKTP
jgi:outer membrane protein OmpA-like peptidoglycan-associated protein